MSAAWWKNRDERPSINDFFIVRTKVNEEFGILPHRVRWAGMNRFNVEAFHIGAQDSSHYTYLLIDGKAIRQN